MEQKVTFSIDEINQLLGMLAEAPLKYSLAPTQMVQQIAYAQLQPQQVAQQDAQVPFADKAED
jgi:hypothetical protein